MSDAAVRAMRARLLAWESTPFYATIPELVAHAAARRPELPACVFIEDDETVTRAALDAESSRLANALAAIGVDRGTVVGVMLPNRREYPITWVALAKIGAVMVPINPRYTERELGYALGDSGASFLVIDEEHVPLFQSLTNRPAALTDEHVVIRGRPVLPGSRAWTALSQGGAPSFSPARPVGGDDIINVQYTSGTTGFPKGCLLPQDYWLVMARATIAWMEHPATRMFAQNPFHYMNCQFMLLMALARDATLFIARRPSATRFLPWIKQHGIEWCVFPEIVLRQPELPDDATTQLKEVLLAAVSPTGQREIERRFKVRARELFGMTEIGPGLAMPFDCTDMTGAGSVGIEMLHRRATIRDENGNPVPDGERGELWMAGRGMMHGYFNKPQANANSFRGEWFRTGDLARRDERGFHYIVGRTKDMIRRSGENIAAREVEVVAMMLPEVIDAAVVPVPDPDRGEEVKLYMVLREGLAPKDLPIERIQAHCRAKLASFKVPRYYAFAEDFPRTASNKIEKGQLKARTPDLRAGAFDAVEGIWR
ncbi:MAG: AMP-binding protein [Polyangiaceae bacterium]|nr:AMP-binding protein [Polyangiaceae bacterium]